MDVHFFVSLVGNKFGSFLNFKFEHIDMIRVIYFFVFYWNGDAKNI